MLESTVAKVAVGLHKRCNMGNVWRVMFSFALVLAGLPAFAQSAAGVRGSRPAPSMASRGYADHRAVPIGSGYSYGGFYPGAYGPAAYDYDGFFPAFGGATGLYTSPLDVPPQGWWASPYPSQNPCQAGCNPNAGYEWDSVGTLILNTNPPTAQVALDGVPAGTTDKLGPFQLPVGEYTLHINAPGFESADVVVKFDRPGVQTLNVELKRLANYAKPAPQE